MSDRSWILALFWNSVVAIILRNAAVDIVTRLKSTP